MRYLLSVLLLLAWIPAALFIAKGYGDWHLPNPFVEHPIDAVIFYLLPLSAIAIAYSTYRVKRFK